MKIIVLKYFLVDFPSFTGSDGLYLETYVLHPCTATQFVGWSIQPSVMDVFRGTIATF